MTAMEYLKSRNNTGYHPVWGCVLIGGESRRMGKPKHLMKRDGVTWLELIVAKLKQRTEKVVISGKGSIPNSLGDIPVVEDVFEVKGPLSGILSIMREYPGVSWLVAACDMPDIDLAALDWLMEQRTKITTAILPDLDGRGLVEPFLAYYDHKSLDLIEKMIVTGSTRPGDLVGRQGVLAPRVPTHLHSSWKNINSPEDITS